MRVDANEIGFRFPPCRDTSRVSSLREVNRQREKKFHIVLDKWVCDCIEAEKILRERDYEP